MSDFEDAMDGLAAIGIAVYLAMVLIRGNLPALLGDVKQEAGFLEFLVALFILSQLAKVDAFKPFVAPITFAAIFILAARIITGTDASIFTKFAQGKSGLFDTLGALFKTQK